MGSNAINNDHLDGAGFNLSITALEYSRFRLGAGINYSNYDHQNDQSPSNFSSSVYVSFFPMLTYEIPVSRRISIFPEVVYGFGFLQQDEIFTPGSDFRVSLFGNYRLNRRLSIVVGAGYQTGKFHIDTRQDLQNYYQQLRAVQFHIGA